jgi:hypothetical protein
MKKLQAITKESMQFSHLEQYIFYNKVISRDKC